MSIVFKIAVVDDSEIIGSLVTKLTDEICVRTNSNHFDIDIDGTIARCAELMRQGHYGAVIGLADGVPIAISTFTESYALYAGGKVGVIPEFYVDPSYRSAGVGAKLIAEVKRYGKSRGWSCIELCTPPLPEFDRTLAFYEENGLKPVGGRKMREHL
jgi:GNAT superfamily N-acetyltransferase|tara:strand:+ start:782 stop:1252 length:471 start_codon:yes stop_codon:yes gene_type:complete